jgi:hypothetical protein
MEPLLRNTTRYTCSSCLRALRYASVPRSIGFQNKPRIARLKHHKSHIALPGEQANALEGFYTISTKPLVKTAPNTRAIPIPPQVEDLPKTEREEAVARARVVFGSRLAGPKDRRAENRARSILVAGILVPPRPDEPDNCCMSGCVNCVWDRYREDLEEWAAKSAEAREAVLAQKAKTSSLPNHVETSMDDDGGGSESNWDQGLNAQDLFADIPVGIREFMKTEKKLQAMHKDEARA